MSHQIRINGRLLDPKKAAKGLLPLDTSLACPECESSQVCAGEARTIEQLGQETRFETPRQQDRRCLACGHRWTVILPPMNYLELARHTLIPGRGR